MPLFSNGIKSQKAGKSGVNNQIYQSFYSITDEKFLENEIVNRSIFS